MGMDVIRCQNFGPGVVNACTAHGDFRKPGVLQVRINYRKRHSISSARSGSTQAPESRRLPVSLIMDVGSRDLCAQGLTAVMTGVQCEDMEVRRHDEMILMSQKQRVQIVDQLSAGGNGDFLRISIEN